MSAENYEVVILGTGPAGLQAAIHAARAKVSVLDTEKFQFILAGKQQQTNIPGIYAAGDICGPPWQVAKAVGEGCVAGLSAARYAKKFRG